MHIDKVEWRNKLLEVTDLWGFDKAAALIEAVVGEERRSGRGGCRG
jgi:hypothetical protein